MAGSIMPVEFRFRPGSVSCRICDSIAGRDSETLPRCPECSSCYCLTCYTNREPSLRCAIDIDDCPLNLLPDPPLAA
jgi:hypothetical protein